MPKIDWRASLAKAGKITRRGLLLAGAAAGGALVVGTLYARRTRDNPLKAAKAGEAVFNAYVKIAADGALIVAVPQAEMGQGIRTALAQCAAEELDMPWERVRVEAAPPAEIYVNTAVVLGTMPDDGTLRRRFLRFVVDTAVKFEGIAMTAGSSSIRNFFDQIRQAGAGARALLVAEAASRWGVAPEACRTAGGAVLHPDGKTSFGYRDLATAAAGRSLDAAPAPKPKSEWKVLGKPLPRLDIPQKVTGDAVFGIDVKLPGMLYATTVHPPAPGQKLALFDPRTITRRLGILGVDVKDEVIWIVGENSWAVMSAAEAVEAQYSVTTADWLHGDDATRAIHAGLARGDVSWAISEGDAAGEIRRSGAAKGAEYATPWLAHLCMEPMNCTAHVTAEKAEIWVGTQSAMLAQREVAAFLDRRPEEVVIHETYLGGGFGRRAEVGVIIEAVDIARKYGKPVQLVLGRAADIARDTFRPAAAIRMRAAVEKDGKPLALEAVVAGQRLDASFAARFKTVPGGGGSGADRSSLEGLKEMPYDIPHHAAGSVSIDLPIEVGYWRAVGLGASIFARESFMDELASAAGRDPFDYRHDMMTAAPRHRHVLQALKARLAARGLDDGEHAGIALHEGYGSVVGTAAIVKPVEKAIRVTTLLCAVDCGAVVNPDGAAAQAEGGLMFGLSAALYGEIGFNRGAVVQRNFDGYPLLDLRGAPEVDIFFLPSDAPPGGMGETTVPGVAPAVANAIYSATGKRVRRLPFVLSVDVA